MNPPLHKSKKDEESDKNALETEILMRDLRRSYPEFAKELEEFKKREMEKIYSEKDD